MKPPDFVTVYAQSTQNSAIAFKILTGSVLCPAVKYLCHKHAQTHTVLHTAQFLAPEALGRGGLTAYKCIGFFFCLRIS